MLTFFVLALKDSVRNHDQIDDNRYLRQQATPQNKSLVVLRTVQLVLFQQQFSVF